LRLLAAYEIAWDFLDTVNEHGAEAGQVNGLQLHLALIEAVDPSASISDYYHHHPWRDDAGYLCALVEACRRCCRLLPAYERVRSQVVQEATRAQVLGINHELDPTRRDATLREWAAQEFPHGHEASWFELTGAASASLTIHALLAMATGARSADPPVERVRDAYFPWISAATTMLDSYVDQAEDTANGDHSYVAHYPSPELAERRIGQLVERCLRDAGALPDGERHVLIVACMAAMYLSKDSARTRAMRETTTSLACTGGSLPLLLLPILRLWRIAYSQRST
jgi:tetraprenyl-beta-curcumene synthase